MPVATQGSVKGVDIERVAELGAQIVLVNTYHLWQRPGHELVKKLGGIHRFMNWDGPILRDSGGFQVFSLEGIRKIKEEGVHFQSHIDGRKLLLTPELSVQIQEALGVDIAMAFDECPDARRDKEDIRQSLDRTHRWEKRCLEARSSEDTSLFAITQGACFPDLRAYSASALQDIETETLRFDGFAIGGLSVGEPIPQMYETLSYHVQQLPHERPRYLMGVGRPVDIVQAVSEGVDLFDCVMPTRSGRFARAFIDGEKPYINIRNAEHRESERPLEDGCECLACRNYSRAYIHHLFRAEEMLGPVLLSVHNLWHYQKLMKDIRESIVTNTFSELFREIKGRWEAADAETDKS